jgi:hypothetical protein
MEMKNRIGKNKSWVDYPPSFYIYTELLNFIRVQLHQESRVPDNGHNWRKLGEEGVFRHSLGKLPHCAPSKHHVHVVGLVDLKKLFVLVEGSSFTP